MGDSGIEWCDKTWNPTRGCRRVSPGCGGANGEGGCYAERQAERIVRMGKGKPTPYDGLVKMTANGPRWTGVGRFAADKLAEPLSWRKPVRVFVDSMSDLFFEEFSNEQIAAVFGVMAACPQHTFQILTKRPKRMREWFEWADSLPSAREQWAPVVGYMYEHAIAATRGEVNGFREFFPDWPLPNVWLGVSVENQDAADERIPDLLATPAAVRFLSCEPLLGPLDLVEPIGKWWLDNEQKPELGWVIAGCESGPGARHCSEKWLRSLRDQCTAAGVPYFLKQAVATLSGDIRTTDAEPYGVMFGPGSKRKPGGIIGAPYLDGRQWLQFPEVTR